MQPQILLLFFPALLLKSHGLDLLVLKKIYKSVKNHQKWNNLKVLHFIIKFSIMRSLFFSDFEYFSDVHFGVKGPLGLSVKTQEQIDRKCLQDLKVQGYMTTKLFLKISFRFSLYKTKYVLCNNRISYT